MSLQPQSLPDKTHELMAQYGVPGVAVGILHNGEEHLAGFGVTNVNHPLPVDADTLFQIGSISKTFTATVAMRLVTEGKLDLDMPIRTYLPDFRLQDADATARATLRHCFTHTGGWLGDYFDDTGDGDDAVAIYVQRMADLPQVTPLGQIWSYNNAGFTLAGHVIEVVTGKPFEQIARDLIFTPLGMDHSFFFAKECITHRVAVGHLLDPAKPDQGATVAEPWALARSAHPAGGIISTVRDLMRYARFHLDDDQAQDSASLLSADGRRAMQEPLAEAGSMAEAVGVSWLLSQIGGAPTFGHGGATKGQMANLRMAPTQRFAITVLTNANRGAELHRDLVNWAFQEYLGLANPTPVREQRSAAQLAEYTGRYAAKMTHLEVSTAENGLRINTIPQGGFPHKDSPPGPQMPPSTAVFIGEDRLLFIDGPARGGRAEVVRDAAGGIAWLRVGGRVHARVSQ